MRDFASQCDTLTLIAADDKTIHLKAVGDDVTMRTSVMERAPKSIRDLAEGIADVEVQEPVDTTMV